MRRQPKARTTKSKSRQDDFYIIKEKAQSRRKENKVELEINMERMGSKIIELHKLSKNSKTESFWIISALTFSVAKESELLARTELENRLF